MSLLLKCKNKLPYLNKSRRSFISGLSLWCLMPLSTIFQLYRGGQFYCLTKQEYLEKTTETPLVTDKLHKSTPRLSRIRTRNVSGDQHFFKFQRRKKTKRVKITEQSELDSLQGVST